MSLRFSRAVLAVFLISMLPRLTLIGEPGIVGQVVDSQGASLAGIQIPGASTILAGDVLATNHSGRALVTFVSGARLNLTRDTSVSFERQPSGVVARISRGNLLAEARNPGTLAIETSHYRITSDGTRTATCLVAVRDDRNGTILAREGRITVTDLRSGAVRNLGAGEEIALAFPAAAGQEPEPSQPAPPRPAGQAPPPNAPAQPSAPAQSSGPVASSVPAAAHKSNTGLILLLVGAGVAGGVGAAAAGGGQGGGGGPVSPSAP